MSIRLNPRFSAVFAGAALAVFCQVVGAATPVKKDGYALKTHERLLGTLRIQTALEHRVACTQAYVIARVRLAEALGDKSWTAALEQTGKYETLPPAVVLDVDETVLDNSPVQARLVLRNVDYSPELWKEWVQEEKAGAIPGAEDFIRHARKKEVAIFFVTNRDVDVEQHTVDNLSKALGLDVRKEQVLCLNEKPGWGSDKTSRRALLAKSHRILLLFGDSFGDFTFLGKVTPEQRVKKGSRYKSYWGHRWIQLPNPLYGDWEEAIYNYDVNLPDKKKLRLKREALDTKEPDR